MNPTAGDEIAMGRKKNEEVDQLSDKAFLMMLAREEFKRSGDTSKALTVLQQFGGEVDDEDAGEPAAPAQIVKAPPQETSGPRGKRTVRNIEDGGRKHCKHCDKTKPVSDFGVRVWRGVHGLQSWCRACRSGTNYHSEPRKYRVGEDLASARRGGHPSKDRS